MRFRKKSNYQALFQQAPGLGLSRIDQAWFPRVDTPSRRLPVVLSIDPGQLGHAHNSFSVIHAYAVRGYRQFVLIEEWREQTDVLGLRRACRRLMKRYRPLAVLIEMTAQGPSLYSSLGPRKSRKFLTIYPTDPKVERLIRNLDTLRAGCVQLAVDEVTAEGFIEELRAFPRGRFTDRIDACTQFLDFMADEPSLEPPAERAVVQGISLAYGEPFPTRLPTPSFGGPVFLFGPRMVVGLKSRLSR